MDDGEVSTVYNLEVEGFHTYFVGCREWGFSVWAHNADYTPYRIEKGRWGVRGPDGRPVPGREYATMRQAENGIRQFQLEGWQQVATPLAKPSEFGSHTGAASGRQFHPEDLGLSMQRRTTAGVEITPQGIGQVEQHVARFGPQPANQGMVQRLRDIASGKIKPTQTDLNFYTHELREFEHYKAMGWERGVPKNQDAAHRLWNNAHTATLEEYGLREGPGVLYHPDVPR